jgi:hypothetical protein
MQRIADRRLVKRKRRIEIQIERRELSVFSSYASRSDAGHKSEAQENGQLPAGAPTQDKPDRCSTCGSTDMLLLSDAMKSGSHGSFKAEFPGTSINCHLQCSSSNEWWVCRPSLDFG